MEEQQRPPGAGGRIKLNVGGKLFETTSSTLQAGGPDSLLAILSQSELGSEIFIDRDPEIFSVLLSLLRSNRLTSTARKFSNQELADEALYYGIDSCLRAAMAPPLLSGIDASHVSTLRPAADAFPTSFSAGSHDGSLWIAHGGQISAYDWILSHVATVRTHLDEITSLRRAWPEVAVVGSTEAPGLHFYNVLSGGRHVGTFHWFDPSDHRVYKARVTSIASDPTTSSCSSSLTASVFAALECPHRENGILAVDKTTLQEVAEIGRQNGSMIKTSAATKLSLVPEKNLIFACAVSAGAFGYSGYMRLWDPRSRDMVWETIEPGSGRGSSRIGDSFADADVDTDRSVIYKVCWKSGDVGMADVRKLGDDPWVYMEERSAGLRNAGDGEGSVVCCYRNQVFVSRVDGLEVWSEVVEGEEKGVYRRNLVDREENAGRGVIGMMEGGGDRLFLGRDRVEGVEVWETSDHSGAIAAIDL